MSDLGPVLVIEPGLVLSVLLWALVALLLILACSALCGPRDPRAVAVAFLVLAAGCSTRRPPTPQPRPTPTPTPTMPLLRTDGPRFVPPILGSVTTHHDWPYLSSGALDAIASAGLNYTAMRLPLMADDRPGFEIYQRVPGTMSARTSPITEGALVAMLAARSPEEAQAALMLSELTLTTAQRQVLKQGVQTTFGASSKFDLTKFNPDWEALEDRTMAYAARKGIYVNKGLCDCWGAIHADEFPMFWNADQNIQGLTLLRPDDFQRPPHPIVLALVDRVVSIVGKYPNVVWELGNEAYRCRPSREFVDAIRNQVRATEARLGYPRHLWSPGSFGPLHNTETGSEFDFISAHGLPRPAGAVPIEVNEFSPQSKGEYLARLADAKRQGITYHYWHDDNPYGGEWDDPAWEREWLDVMKAMKDIPAATGCTTVPGEDATAVQPRPRPPQAWTDAINAAMRRLRPDCDVGGRCVLDVGMQTWLNAVAEEVRRGDAANPPLCAAVQVDSEGPVDEVCIGTETRCTGWHAYACRPGCATGTIAWAPGSHRDTWLAPGEQP